MIVQQKKNGKQTRAGKSLRQRALLVGAFGIGVLLAGVQYYLSGQMLNTAHSHTRLQAAGLRQAGQRQEPPDEVVEPPPPLVIEADATQGMPEDPALFRTICDAFGTASGQAASGTQIALAPLSNEVVTADSGPDWFLWGRMGTERAAVTLAVPQTEERLRLYAVHSPQGATVCLINRSEQKIPIQLQLRLPRGVYKWERLSFAPPLPTEARGVLSAAAWREGAEAVPLAVRLDRLQSVELAEANTVTKPGVLLPGEFCIYRCTDVARAARAAVYETRTRLEEMARTAPDSARNLRRILDEGGDFLDYVCAGSGSSRERRLSGIHHFLLVTAQAHSVHHNLQERHNVSAEVGAATMGALERLTDGLAETSAAILGLVPRITVEPEVSTPPAAQPEAKETPALLVTVSIANAGSRNVEMVKIGLDTASLPAGTRCSPEDPAFFGGLHPGETLRATFHLRGPAALSVPASRYVGDVSYFVAGAPAHLRPRPW